MPEKGREGVKPEDSKIAAKMRVYEVAKDIGVANKTLVAKIQSLGIDVKNHMSSLDADTVARVKRALEKERQDNLVEERLNRTVIRRRSRVSVSPPSVAAEPGAPARAPAAARAPGAAEDVEPDPPDLDLPAAGEQPEPLSSDTPEDFWDQAEDSAGEDQAAAPDPELQGAMHGSTAETSEPGDQAADEGDLAIPMENNSSEGPERDPPQDGREPAEEDGPAAQDELPRQDLGVAVVQAVSEVTAPEKPKIVHRYAPGFKPGMTYGPKARQVRPAAAQPPSASASEEKPLSAADALALMSTPKPKVVITDLDGHGPNRRQVVTHKDLFQDRRFKTGGKRRKKATTTKKGKKTEITTPAQHKRVIRLQDSIAVGEIARQMGIKATEVLKKLWALGLTNISINQTIDSDTASLLAADFDYEIEDVSFKEAEVIQEVEDLPEDLQDRAPVVTVMGHVDHGKTSLLDAIRNTTVAQGEAGGITQHIGASVVETADSRIVFLDTPGHEAFTRMRARGADCTDIVVLVVAANDGVMPQTVEALDHARSAQVPIIVAINKMDLPDANPDRVRNELAERGLVPEEWGGETMFVEVSARTHVGVDSVLEAISLQAEVLELKANPDKLAKGMVIESRLDRAKGAMCSVLIQEGTLHVGDTVVTGEIMGKVRAMIDDRGRLVKEAGPCTPVEILGLGGVPEAGDALNAVADEKAARTLVEYRRDTHRQRDQAGVTSGKTYEDILRSIQSGESRELKLLLKADVHGSAEAVRDSLIRLSTEKVAVNVIASAVGGITENDVNLAKASGALILGFSVRPAGKAASLAEREGVEIRVYDVIYEMLDEVKVMMQGLLPKERREKLLGHAEVRETFTIPKVGVIAGCSVKDGKITRNSQLRLIRDAIKIFDGRVSSLRRFKDDVKEVVQGFECGIGIDGTKDIHIGDIIEAYEVEEVAASLD